MKQLRLGLKWPQNLAFKPSKAIFLSFLFALVSCQKEVSPTLLETDMATNRPALSRDSDLEADVVNHAQWVTNFMVPLIADEAAREDLEAGNYTSASVTAKLVSLGFSDFADFTQTYLADNGAVFSALQSGALTSEAIQQVLTEHFSDLDFGPIGGKPAEPDLPCYQQFVTELAFTPLVIAAATGYGSPLTGIIAGLVYVASVYNNYRNCLRENYPNGG